VQSDSPDVFFFSTVKQVHFMKVSGKKPYLTLPNLTLQD